ncbi:MAG: hypothetical protein LBG43_01965 [Treponema sp.]|nr:hypothetical protein [Treponema sp.]
MESDLFESIIRTSGADTDDLFDEPEEPIALSGTLVDLFEAVLWEANGLPSLSKEIEINDDEKRLIDAYKSDPKNSIERKSIVDAIRSY